MQKKPLVDSAPVTMFHSGFNLFQRLNQVMREVTSIAKGTSVAITQSSSYKAVSHDDVAALLHTPLAMVGVLAFPDMVEATVETYETKKEYNGKVTIGTGYLVKVWASVTFINVDAPEERIVSKCFSYALDSGDKAVGKAYSMALKYCYLKTFMLESFDDEESRSYENYNHAPATPAYSNKGPLDPAAAVSSSEAMATPAQLGAIKKLYPMSFLDKLDPTAITKKYAGELISNAPKNK
jgi:hypothetical protein